MNIVLWIVQVLLALAFGFFGFTHLTQPVAEIAKMAAWAGAVPAGLVRIIGVAELLGAVGLILPALTKIQPRLTFFAALGLVAIMVLAAITHVTRGELPFIGINVVLGGLAGLVAYGRRAVGRSARRWATD